MAIAATAATLLLCSFLLPFFGARIDGLALLMCIICPMAIGWPASAFQFTQTEKLREAHSRIAEMHEHLEAVHNELAQAHIRLTEKARRDSLTGILHREGFFNLVRTHRQESRSGALLVIDIDHFKSINDRFGHLAGDDVLKAICNAIAAAIGPGPLFGRIGGEEFAVFLPDATQNTAAALAEKIRNDIARLAVPNELNANISLTVSIGGALDNGEMTLTQFFKAADMRLYQAKRLGRNRVMMGNGMMVAV